MADNLTTQAAIPATVPALTGIACRAVTYSGDASQCIAPTGLVVFGGSDDAKTATDVSSSTPLPVAIPGGSTATHANVTENTSSVTLIAANTARLSWSIYNDSDAALNIRLGAGASASVFAIRLLPGGFASDKDFGPRLYLGLIAGIWDSAPGTAGHNAARTMELTA